MKANDIVVGVKYEFRRADGTTFTALCTYKEERDGLVIADFGRFAYVSRISYKIEFRIEGESEWKDINEED